MNPKYIYKIFTNSWSISKHFLVICIIFRIGVTTVSARCSSGFYQCADGTCIENGVACDGTVDCPDKSDETESLCKNQDCRDQAHDIAGFSLFKCDYGACIPGNFICNGITNCADASDESSARCSTRTCNKREFRCGNGACLRHLRACDGRANCVDASDETEEVCKRFNRKRTCSRNRRVKLTCLYGACLTRGAECDGVKDCLDGSDEREELCGPIQTTPTTTTSTTTTTTTTTSTTTPLTTEPSTTTTTFSVTTPTSFCSPPMCQCSQSELEFICLPCNEIFDLTETCEQLLNYSNSGCSIYSSYETSLNILSCGIEQYAVYNNFARGWGESCIQDGHVPPMTVVHADCWGVAGKSYRCHTNGFWYEHGKTPTGSISNDRAMRNLCQPHFINSDYCGRKAQFRSSGMGQIDKVAFFNKQNLRPYVVGIKKRQQFDCTGAVISPYFVITAGHCVMLSQETNIETVPPQQLLIQYSDDITSDLYVKSIHLHQGYVGGLRPINDVALIQLHRPIQFNSRFYPICLNDMMFDVSPIDYAPPAIAFHRPENLSSNEFQFNEIIHQVDPRCQQYGQRCSFAPITNSSQFCGLPADQSSVPLVKGDSGGPFLQSNLLDLEELWVLTGIVSSRVGAEHCQMPHTIFTDVASYSIWIKNIVHSFIR